MLCNIVLTLSRGLTIGILSTRTHTHTTQTNMGKLGEVANVFSPLIVAMVSGHMHISKFVIICTLNTYSSLYIKYMSVELTIKVVVVYMLYPMRGIFC